MHVPPRFSTSMNTNLVTSAATNCLNQIMLAMDNGDEQAFASAFDPAGTCRVRIMNKEFTGESELAGLCATLHAKFKGMRHWEGNVCIQRDLEANPIRFLNTSYWKAMDGGECVSTGMHEDVLKYDEVTGTCVIQNRIVTHFWTKAAGHIEQ